MRVLAVGLLYPPHYLGGYELICEGAMRAAAARGHEVQVLASDYRAPDVSAPDQLPVDRALRSYLDRSARRIAPVGRLGALRIERHNGAALDRHLRELRPDVVSFWGMGGLSLSLIERVRRAGTPSLLYIADHWLDYGAQSDRWTSMTRRLRLGPLARPLGRALGVPLDDQLETAGRFLYASDYMREAAAAAGFRAPDAGILTPGVNRRFKPSSPPAGWAGRLLYVGRLDPGKGIDVILAALPGLPAGVSLDVVGAGEEDYQRELREQARALGLEGRVRFSGSRPAAQLPDLYAAADAVIFPVRWQEPWGLVPLEAMASGRPVVATARGGAAGYLRDGRNALVIPAEDPAALADAVARLAGSPELRQELRRGGLATAEAHSEERFEREIVAELERAAGHGGS